MAPKPKKTSRKKKPSKQKLKKKVNVLGLTKDTVIENQIVQNGKGVVNLFKPKHNVRIKQQKVTKGGSVTNIF
ncbi:MAG: hypothetical protein ACTSUE_07690 [Promethearchaeota archaeon]